MSIPKITFSNGFQIPILGIGTWRAQPGQVTKAVEDAIEAGYRHIDCAYAYRNEKEVRLAIKNKIAEGIVKREDLFVTSKLWNTFHRPDLVEEALKMSLKNLELDYLDLYLIHWPFAYKEGGDMVPKDVEGGILYSDVHYVDTWKALEPLVQKGLVRSLGVSNFNKRQIEDVLDIATVKPVNLQVECHPYLNQKRLIEFCKTKNITVTGYGPLGSPCRPWAQSNDPILLEDVRFEEIGSRYNKSIAQVLIRFQVQRGVITIPKSVTTSRIQSNFNVFDFELTEADMNLIDSFDYNGRLCPVYPEIDHPLHPFKNDEF